MGSKETEISNRIMFEEAKHGRVLFKNVKGMFLTLDGKRKVRAGLLVPGSHDLIGFDEIVITQSMVGKKIAQFVSLEVKTDDGYPSKDQKHFRDEIIRRGGKSGIARSAEDARKI